LDGDWDFTAHSFTSCLVLSAFQSLQTSAEAFLYWWI
jgi:hypothetical protein